MLSNLSLTANRGDWSLCRGGGGGGWGAIWHLFFFSRVKRFFKNCLFKQNWNQKEPIKQRPNSTVRITFGNFFFNIIKTGFVCPMKKPCRELINWQLDRWRCRCKEVNITLSVWTVHQDQKSGLFQRWSLVEVLLCVHSNWRVRRKKGVRYFTQIKVNFVKNAPNFACSFA